MICWPRLGALAAIALLWQPALTCAQHALAPAGQITGTVSDPSGAFIRGADLTAVNLATGAQVSSRTDSNGQFTFSELPAGVWRVSVHATGFQTTLLPAVNVSADRLSTAEVILGVAPATADVEVEAHEPGSTATAQQPEQSGSASGLLSNVPGVSFRGDALFSSVPLLHGLGDERTKILVDGMSVSPSCPNHMNPPLTYVPPADADRITVIAGITPVSEGGDSLGGTISIHSPPPLFAAPGEHIREQASVSPFYASNGASYGGSLSAWIAGPRFAFGYNGSFASSDDYTDGTGDKVTSTYGRRVDNAITLAARRGSNLVVLTAGLHTIPFQGFVNARMDMLDNRATRLNFHYRHTFSHGNLDARLYYQNTAHTMNLGRDKAALPMAMFMPMNSHGTDSGYSFQYEVPLSPIHTLRLGSEMHRFVLNDFWPPVAGQAPMMGPGSFVDINNGRRTRLGTFAEVASQWNPRWASLFGLRNDTIWSKTGPVQGYSMMYAADAQAFNASNRARTDVDVDVTALVRYHPRTFLGLEIGYARKSRAPSLYERYAWSTDPMTSSMIGWFGDGNDYIGNLALHPEVAHTVSGTLNLQSATVQFTVTPYVTWIRDYVDVNRLQTIPAGMSMVAQLQFANHPARIAGADFSGSTRLWNHMGLGRGSFSAVAAWLRGERTDANTGLYDMMPVHARIEIDQDYERWQNGVSVQFVDRKSSVDPLRFEHQTPGYALFGIQTAYHRGSLRFSLGATNLMNREYLLPLGGVNMDAFLDSGSMGSIEPVSGLGRSLNSALTVRF